MKNIYHILNGDALKGQLPEQITGKTIIMRECLIEGGVQGRDLDDFFSIRADFISKSYKEFTKKDYYSMSVTEMEKMQNIPEGSEINFWFEDDLLCQVNLWFVLDLLAKKRQRCPFFLVRPTAGYEYGFGGMSEACFMQAYASKKEITFTELQLFRSLWKGYQANNYEELVRLGNELSDNYPFVLPAIQAHGARASVDGSPGRPEQTLLNIIRELQTTEFSTIFKEFSKREAIYGFGDLQVQRLLAKVITQLSGLNK
ncbi:DUF1835 domain-containing protein [Desulforhopalus sp. IMCC35007]|uniref:DUF1835 domain-containing protein n=1 Tax=Desulforhopalus sp. IMCC35007 TaxID=2569543 RepID=UPI0010ADF7D3|nr:DUF1835 domain-containing protein [Desulforhopalus sp. IMCC35007]TKB07340.1 DUF1835 domain-containing protein [Desulforhopalus sp. IMCC35007]